MHGVRAVTSRLRNLILILAAGAFALVLLGHITGADWLAWVGQLVAGAAK